MTLRNAQCNDKERRMLLIFSGHCAIIKCVDHDSVTLGNEDRKA